MRQVLCRRVRLDHSPFPFGSSHHKLTATTLPHHVNVSSHPKLHDNSQARITTSSTIPQSGPTLLSTKAASHLNWSQTAHQPRSLLPTSLSTMSRDLQLNPAQARGHMGHSHGHGHSHDTSFLTSKNKNDPGVRITRIGLYVNVGMAIGKGIGGYVFNSQAYAIPN